MTELILKYVSWDNISLLTVKVGIGTVIATGIFATGYYFFGHHLRKQISKDGAEIVMSPDVINGLNQLLKHEELVKNVSEFIKVIVSDPHIVETIKNTLQKILADEKIQMTIHEFLLMTLANVQVKNQIYDVLKKLFTELSNDDDIKQLIIKFVSTTLMESLNKPVNEKLLKDKLIEMISNDEIKKEFGDNIVKAVRVAVKEQLPTIGMFL